MGWSILKWPSFSPSWGRAGVLNLEGIQTRYEDPNPILDRITAVGKAEFVGLMQELYAEPIKPQLIELRIQEIQEKGGIAAVSLTPAGAVKYGAIVAQAGRYSLCPSNRCFHCPFIPGSYHPLDLVQLCQEMPIPWFWVTASPTKSPLT
jgi:IMP dehydrogenase